MNKINFFIITLAVASLASCQTTDESHSTSSKDHQSLPDGIKNQVRDLDNEILYLKELIEKYRIKSNKEQLKAQEEMRDNWSEFNENIEAKEKDEATIKKAEKLIEILEKRKQELLEQNK